ncbi:MAG: hypothetical protein NTU95_05570 [Methanothrix sp.]|nr:hypothetical protein [Methanothrix sp.]
MKTSVTTKERGPSRSTTVLGPDDLLTSFKPSPEKVGQNNLGVFVISAHICRPEGKIPVWLFYHDRSLAPIRRTIGDVQKNIRRGKLLNEDFGPRSMNLTAEIALPTCGDISTSFYDFKTPKGRVSFAFLAGCGYKVDLANKEALGVFSAIINNFKEYDKGV